MTGDRRPIAARSLRPVRAVADWLVRHGASPNAISVAGMVAAIGAGGAFATGTRAGWLVGAALVQARLMANLLDGMVAIGRGVASPRGELYNEVPDRVSDTAVLGGVGWAVGQPALGLAVALLAMATAYVRAVGKAAGAGSEFCGPMAKQQRMAVVTGLGVWNALAPASWGSAWTAGVLWAIGILTLFTAIRRLVRIARTLS